MTDNLDRAHVRALGDQASARRSRPFDVLDAGVEHHETISMSDLQVRNFALMLRCFAILVVCALVAIGLLSWLVLS